MGNCETALTSKHPTTAEVDEPMRVPSTSTSASPPHTSAHDSTPTGAAQSQPSERCMHAAGRRAKAGDGQCYIDMGAKFGRP
eukprot:1369339-Pleurochrysis_carterae.AAC.2